MTHNTIMLKLLRSGKGIRFVFVWKRSKNSRFGNIKWIGLGQKIGLHLFLLIKTIKLKWINWGKKNSYKSHHSFKDQLKFNIISWYLCWTRISILVAHKFTSSIIIKCKKCSASKTFQTRTKTTFFKINRPNQVIKFIIKDFSMNLSLLKQKWAENCDIKGTFSTILKKIQYWQIK